MCTRGGLLKKTAAVYMFSLYPLKLSEGKKRKILKVREELRLGTCQSTFFFAFGAAAVANCYRATLCLAEQKNIFLQFVQKYQDIMTHSFHFWHFFPVEDLKDKRRNINSESSRRASAQSMSVHFFFCFWRRCRRQLLPRHIMPRKTEEYIFAFCSKISRYYGP